MRERALKRHAGDAAFWGGALALACVLFYVVYPTDNFTAQFVLFALYAAMNLMWMLVIGTAGIYSFATVAIVGASAYLITYYAGGSPSGYDVEGARALPIPVMLLMGVGAGIVCGLIVALPGIRLRGVYFALFTIGLVELGRAIVVSTTDIGLTLGQNQGLYGATQFTKVTEVGTSTGRNINFLVALALVAFCLVVYRVVDSGRLGLLLRTARESEPVARDFGIDINRARLAVFIISSAILGMIGGFYTGFYGGVSPQIFSFETLLLLLAMMVVGGLGSAKGVILGTAFLYWIDITWADGKGPFLDLENPVWRTVIIGIIMLIVVLVAPRGLVGIPAQVRELIGRQRSQRAAPAAGEPAAGATKAR